MVGINSDDFMDDDDEDDNEAVINEFNVNNYDLNNDDDEAIVSNDNDDVATVKNYEAAADRVNNVRSSVRISSKQQADRMIHRSKKFMPVVHVGDFVIVPVG